jgi:hypothetical protein
MSTGNIKKTTNVSGEKRTAGACGWQPYRYIHVWANCLGNVRYLTSHNPIGLHGLLLAGLYFIYHLSLECYISLPSCLSWFYYPNDTRWQIYTTANQQTVCLWWSKRTHPKLPHTGEFENKTLNWIISWLYRNTNSKNNPRTYQLPCETNLYTWRKQIRVKHVVYILKLGCLYPVGCIGSDSGVSV